MIAVHDANFGVYELLCAQVLGCEERSSACCKQNAASFARMCCLPVFFVLCFTLASISIAVSSVYCQLTAVTVFPFIIHRFRNSCFGANRVVDAVRVCA